MTTNALTNFLQNSGGQLTISDDAMADALDNVVEETSTGSGGGVTYLNFSGKLGKYSLGREKEEVDPEEIFLLEPQSIFTGWQCWKSSKPIAKHKWSVFAPHNAIAEQDLEDHGPYKTSAGEGWKRMLGFGVVTTQGEPISIEFSTDSVSGRNAVAALLDEVRQRARAGEPTIPLISFQAESFVAQDQKNYKPKFVSHAWVTREQAAAMFSTSVDYDLDDALSGKKLTAAQKKKLAA